MYSTNLWHPCSQMKDYETFEPLKINQAAQEFLYLSNGEIIIDGISSWWCKSLGHSHPKLKAALLEQFSLSEHTILANTTNATIEQLTQKLCQLTNTDKVLLASDGSCAIEMALKLATHARIIEGQAHKTDFIALKNGYHGETTGALSVSDLPLYKAPYKNLLFDCYFLDNLPYINSSNDPLWHSAKEDWLATQEKLEQVKSTTNAIIVEPIIQGAGGMLIYSPDFLSQLSLWCRNNDVYLIADEIMTGMGRCGKILACEYANITPDFICLSKGLTAGVLPLSVTLTSNNIYQIFYDDYAKNKAFLHSHTHSGNTLACAVALKVMEILEQECLIDHINNTLQPVLIENMLEIAKTTGKLTNVRGLGAMVAADIITSDPRAGYKTYQKAIKLGALLRPLGNTIYWMPPFNISTDSLEKLKNITQAALQ